MAPIKKSDWDNTSPLELYFLEFSIESINMPHTGICIFPTMKELLEDVTKRKEEAEARSGNCRNGAGPRRKVAKDKTTPMQPCAADDLITRVSCCHD